MKLKFTILILVAGWLSGAACNAGDFVYTNFTSLDGLILQDNAAARNGRLRLTPAKASRAGGLWLSSRQPVQDGFDTTFQIQMTDKDTYGADGMAFVIENGPMPQVGDRGHEIGYGGISNLVVVKFDDYHWRRHDYFHYDEIAVMKAASPETRLWDSVSNTVASATNGIVFSDGRVHTARIQYISGNLRVYLDDLKHPVMSVDIDVARAVDLDRGRGWVGFTAATGSDWQNQDVLSWSFSSDDTASRVAEMVMETNAENGTNTRPPYRTMGAGPEPATLASDPRFGYALPGDLGPGLRIEASGDLVRWTELTNAEFFFRDPESTNYATRFYRFSPE